MSITREFLEKRIANLRAEQAKHSQAAQQHTTMVHTLSGAIQDATHILHVFDGKAPNTGDVPSQMPGQGMGPQIVKTDVTMDAEVQSGQKAS